MNEQYRMMYQEEYYISHGSKLSLPIQGKDLYIIVNGSVKPSAQCIVIIEEK